MQNLFAKTPQLRTVTEEANPHKRSSTALIVTTQIIMTQATKRDTVEKLTVME